MLTDEREGALSAEGRVIRRLTVQSTEDPEDIQGRGVTVPEIDTGGAETEGGDIQNQATGAESTGREEIVRREETGASRRGRTGLTRVESTQSQMDTERERRRREEEAAMMEEESHGIEEKRWLKSQEDDQWAVRRREGRRRRVFIMDRRGEA
jgi:hypothetical protein